MFREHKLENVGIWIGNHELPKGTFDRSYLEIEPRTNRVLSIFLRDREGAIHNDEPGILIHTKHRLSPSRLANEAPARYLTDKLGEYRSLKRIHPEIDRVYHEYDILRGGYMKEILEGDSIPGSDRCIFMTAEELREKNYTGFYIKEGGVTHTYTEDELICYATNPERDSVTVWWKNVDGEDCFSTYQLRGRTRMGLISDDILDIHNH